MWRTFTWGVAFRRLRKSLQASKQVAQVIGDTLQSTDVSNCRGIVGGALHSVAGGPTRAGSARP